MDRSQHAILLFDEEEGHGIRGFGQSYVILIQMLFNPFGEHISFHQIKGVDFTIQDRGGIGCEVYGMVVVSCWQELLSFFFQEYLGMSLVFLRDSLEVFILISLDGPFLSKVSAINNYFVIIFPFICPCESAVHLFSGSDEISHQGVESDFCCGFDS